MTKPNLTRFQALDPCNEFVKPRKRYKKLPTKSANKWQ